MADGRDAELEYKNQDKHRWSERDRGVGYTVNSVISRPSTRISNRRRSQMSSVRLTSMPMSLSPPWTTSMDARTPPGHPRTLLSFLPTNSSRTSRASAGFRSPCLMRCCTTCDRVAEMEKATGLQERRREHQVGVGVCQQSLGWKTGGRRGRRIWQCGWVDATLTRGRTPRAGCDSWLARELGEASLASVGDPRAKGRHEPIGNQLSSHALGAKRATSPCPTISSAATAKKIKGRSAEHVCGTDLVCECVELSANLPAFYGVDPSALNELDEHVLGLFR